MRDFRSTTMTTGFVNAAGFLGYSALTTNFTGYAALFAEGTARQDLYLCVSTDEQKRRGYSLPEQEDRLLKYFDSNVIKVKGVYKEDFSAKNFIKPEWKKLILEIKKNKDWEENDILFVKWDKFTRNIQYAY